MKIFNSLGREKKEFVPLIAGTVSIYVCGMTVYDFCHLGHARVMIFFDIVRRWFEACGLNVNYVRNITDVDDKIIARAREQKISIRELTDKYIHEMKIDAKSLDIIDPSIEPRATDYIPEMLDFIDKLQSSGYAYESDGDVNFSVRNFKEYGKLSGKTLDELRAGERVPVGNRKKDPLDFVLWKKTKSHEPSEVSWNSPYGPGRPGWHLECSTMSCELLGPKFDIHGGGIDLQFPHHENEIAQSEGALNTKAQVASVGTWMHVGFVTVEKEKMSKSFGNFSTIRDILKEVNPETVRYFLLKGHYRSPVNYSVEQITNAKNALKSLYGILERSEELEHLSIIEEKNYISFAMSSDNKHALKFRDAINDDFNTPLALSELFAFANKIKLELKSNDKSNLKLYRGLGLILGFFKRPLEKEKKSNPNMKKELNESLINDLLSERVEAKKNKNYERADEIRNYLKEFEILVEDTSEGTKWRRS
ncbi:MAG: cysteine--tRNA ligase [Betaproteobacteria bacterium TMED156]|nr:MAG: cysteine--tRNA ligase [Betaproteobacteria bacterium TMED156]